MIVEEFGDDPLLQALRRIAADDVDRVRAERIRARCHRALAGRGPNVGLPSASARATRALEALEVVTIAGSCLAFLAEVCLRAIRLYG